MSESSESDRPAGPLDRRARPRLARHVLARRYVTTSARLVVLFDIANDRTHQIAERSWSIASLLDGSRDLDGVVARAALDGVRVSVEEVAEFVGDLGREGLLTEEAATDERAPLGFGAATAPEVDALDRPIEHLPGFSLDCDGSGSCCRFYATISFTPLEAARARAHLPLVQDAGNCEPRAFMPQASVDIEPLAVTLVKGRCAYLLDDLRCGIHAAARAEDKPRGCQVYPARLVDDGASIRVSPWMECACVIRSGAYPSAAGSRLIAADSVTRRDLDPALHVETLPDEVLISAGRSAPRAELHAWSRAVAAASVRDGAGGLLALERAIAAHGLDPEASVRAIESAPRAKAADLEGGFAALAKRLEPLVNGTWRSGDDLVRQTAIALATACDLARDAFDELAMPPPALVAAEAFYVRGLAFGHHLVPRTPTRVMTMLLRDRAMRVIVARALAVVAALGELRDPAFRQPIALVEAIMRGYGGAAYLREWHDLSP